MEKKHIIELTNKYAQYVEKKPNDKYYRQLWMLSCTALFLKSEPNAQVLLDIIKKLQNTAEILNRRKTFFADLTTLKCFVEDFIFNKN